MTTFKSPAITFPMSCLELSEYLNLDQLNKLDKKVFLEYLQCSRQWPEVSDFVARFCTLRESKHTAMRELNAFRSILFCSALLGRRRLAVRGMHKWGLCHFWMIHELPEMNITFDRMLHSFCI